MFLQINHTITNLLNNFILENNLENLVWFFADAPIFFLPIFFIWFWVYYEKYYFEEKKFSNLIKNFFSFKENFLDKKKFFKSKILLIFYSITFWLIINLIIQQLFFFDRPETLITPILQHIPDASFPSDHATVSFAFLFWLFFAWYKKIFYSFFLLVILMNIARIAWWLHWFFDIFAGLIISLFSVLLVFKNQKNKYLINLNNFILNIAKFFKL